MSQPSSNSPSDSKSSPDNIIVWISDDESSSDTTTSSSSSSLDSRSSSSSSSSDSPRYYSSSSSDSDSDTSSDLEEFVSRPDPYVLTRERLQSYWCHFTNIREEEEAGELIFGAGLEEILDGRRYKAFRCFSQSDIERHLDGSKPEKDYFEVLRADMADPKDFPVLKMNGDVLMSAMRSCSLMQRIHSIKLGRQSGAILVVKEYCSGGSIEKFVRDHMEENKRHCDGSHQFMEEEDIALVCHSVLRAIEFWHTSMPSWSFRSTGDDNYLEIRASTIFVAGEGEIKLSGYEPFLGFRNTDSYLNWLNRSAPPYDLCPYWKSPDRMMREGVIPEKVDVWSLGISVFEMIEGHPPHYDIHPMRATMMIIHRGPPTLSHPESHSPELVDFLSCCVKKDPKERWSVRQLLQHPFIETRTSRFGIGNREFLLTEERLDFWMNGIDFACGRIRLRFVTSGAVELLATKALLCDPFYRSV